MIRRVTRSKFPFMERYKPLFGLTLAALLLGGCVYVPPPEHYGGPPPPPDVPPPYHIEEPPPPDYYFGRGRSRRNFELEYRHGRRGRTEYLREVDPDYAMEREAAEDGSVTPPEGYTPDPDFTGPSKESQSPSQTSPPSTPAPAPKIDPATVPYGTKTNTPGRAKSPYAPYRELDVSGMRSGSLAKDPTTGKVFRVP